MMIAAPTSSSESVEDGGNFSADPNLQTVNSDDEQLDYTPFLSHQLSENQESFSEKFLRNILTHDYQNLMPRRREKFVEIIKTVTVTEIVNGASDKHPSSCEVKVTNVSPAGPHPVNVSIKHLHENWHSCEELDKPDDGKHLGKGTIIRIEEAHKPLNCNQKKQQAQNTKFEYEDVVNTKMESSTKCRRPSSSSSTLFNRSSDNIVDLEFRHPILVETSENIEQKSKEANGTRRRFADLRKKVSTTTKTSVTETEKVTTTRRSSSAHTTSSKRSYSKPEVRTLYYRKFVDEEEKEGNDDSSDSGSVIIRKDSVTRRSHSADHLQHSPPAMSPIAPPRKRLGREESLHYYRDDEEVIREQIETEKTRKVTVQSPEPGNTSISMNDAYDDRNLTAGITSISMNDTCTDTSYESRFSTIPRARSSSHVNHIHINVIGPTRTPESERQHPVVGRAGDDVTMDIVIERKRSASASRKSSHAKAEGAPPKPPRRSKYEEHIRIGEPIATSTPMTTIERKQTREERISTESGQSSRKSTRSARPPDISITECETIFLETRSPARTPATPIVVINQTPSSRRSSQDILGDSGPRRRKSTVTDIDWYAAFNMKDPSSPTKIARPSFTTHSDDRKHSRDTRRRASDSSMIGLPTADIDLNQIFACTVPPEIKKDEKCQCNACRLIRMSETERALRIERASRARQSRSFTRTREYETRSSTLPSRHRTSPVNIELEDIFNPKPPFSSPVSTKPPTPARGSRHSPFSPVAPSQSSFADEPSSGDFASASIDRIQVTPVTTTLPTNSKGSGPQLSENPRNQLFASSDDWVSQMMHDANEWENRVSNRKSSIVSTTSSTTRKVSVARRISVDELKTPEKKMPREPVPLPPSDASIDEIFTALAPKKDSCVTDSERKTFIVTRKLRAQDVDVIDFEKDHQAPVAPPRRSTQESGADNLGSSEVTITLNLKEKEISIEEKKDKSSIFETVDESNDSLNDTHNVPRDSVFSEKPLNNEVTSSTVSVPILPSEPIKNRLEYNTESQKQEQETITSAVSIDLEKVFVQGSSGRITTNEPDEKIRRGIAEFEKSKKEKEAQKIGQNVSSHSKHIIVDESDISMDEVFNEPKNKEPRSSLAGPRKLLNSEEKNVEVSIPYESLVETSTSSIAMKPAENTEDVTVSVTSKDIRENEIPAASIDLNEVFATGAIEDTRRDDSNEKIRKGIAEFEKSKQEKEAQKIGQNEISHSTSIINDESNDEGRWQHPSRSDVVYVVEEIVEKKIKKTTKRTETETETYSRKIYKPLRESSDDDICLTGSSEPVISTQTVLLNDGSNTENTDLISAADINLDDIFVQSHLDETVNNDRNTKIQKGISDFERALKEKESQRSLVTESSHTTKSILDSSTISLDDVFENASNEEEKHSAPFKKVISTASIQMTPSEQQTISITVDKKEALSTNQFNDRAAHETSTINLDDVFVKGPTEKSRHLGEDDKIRRGIAEFERSMQEKGAKRSGDNTHSSFSRQKIFEESYISLDEVFEESHDRHDPVSSTHVDKSFESETANIVHDNKDESDVFPTSGNIKREGHGKPEDAHPEAKENISRKSSISLEEIFNTSGVKKISSSNFEETTSKTTRTEKTTETTETHSRKSVSNLDNLFGPAISDSAISFDSHDQSPLSPDPPRIHRKVSSFIVSENSFESVNSNDSLISLDDSFNNSLVTLRKSQLDKTKSKRPLTLPVNNWIDHLVVTATNEATKEAPKTPKGAALDYFTSPTRISQEIKYEWVADLIGDDTGKKLEEDRKEEHQSEEKHLQKQDNTWVSSVVYRPSLATNAYTLRASKAELDSEKPAEIDMDRVIIECLTDKKNGREKCESSACQLTGQDLEDIQKRKIELENMVNEKKQFQPESHEESKNLDVPFEFSIDDVFNSQVQLHVQTDNTPVPSTSSPPLERSNTYYISPTISETVTTIHQWKDANISMDDIFCPVSPANNDNHNLSNFYEDRNGWDTIRSEDSGVISGGDRGRRRSTKTTDQVIDEAFKGVFDAQMATSTATAKQDSKGSQYDDYYITSLHQEDANSTDSEVDGKNLDVSQFVDDILGKSLDEAAFLSSTKSFRDLTDTSIDRKKSTEKIHSYYRTRTDTSIDRRPKQPEVINEDSETAESQSNDEIMKLVFVDPSDPPFLKSDSQRSLSLKRSKSFTKPNDEELLEIEVKPDYFHIKGSYSLLIAKSDPLGKMLQKLCEQNDTLAILDFSLTCKLKKLLVNCIRERAGCLDMTSTSSLNDGLSYRGQRLIESVDHASATFLKMNVDKYNPTHNPKGVVNFCTAENNICTPLLEERFKHLELFFPNIDNLVRYPPAGGWPAAREALVKYFKDFMGARVTVDELVLTASTRTGYDVTSYCLFEQDDILLTNGPVYTGTISNVQEKAQCQIACVQTDLSNPRLDVKVYDEELARQTALGNIVSGVIIVNPHNPLGVTFPPEEVVTLCNWAASKNLMVVIDEVFANCVFDKANCKFRPFLSYRHRTHHPENIAWLWSVSKDFGLPGLKFAVLHSANEGLRAAATKLQLYYPCSPFVQNFAVKLLSDTDWLREFHAEVNKRIAIHYRYTTDNLKRLEIPFVPAQAGIFVFADFSKHLLSVSEDGELELFERLALAGVMLTPGVHQKCHVFGWFRIVFACTKEELEEGFRRLYAHLGSRLHPVGTIQYHS